jgi:hypothetical protein
VNTVKNRKEQRAGRRWKHSPQKGRKGDTPLDYLEQTALRREQCNGLAQRVSRQWLGKHVPIWNSGRCVSVDECCSSLLATVCMPMNLLSRNHVTYVFCVVHAEPV